MELAGLDIRPTIEIRPCGAKEQVTLDGSDCRVIVRLHRDPHEAITETVEVDDDRLFLFFLFGRVGLLALLFALLLFGLARLLILELHLVALRWEERLDVLPQSEDIDSVALIAGIVPLEVGDLRRVMTLGNEEKIVALCAPDRRIRVEEIRGDLARLTAGAAPDEDPEHPGLIVETEGEVAAVGRPLIAEHLTIAVVCDLDFGSVRHRDYKELAVLVREGDALAIRRPERVAELCFMAAADLFCFAVTSLIGDPDLVLPTRVGNVGDVLTIR